MNIDKISVKGISCMLGEDNERYFVQQVNIFDDNGEPVDLSKVRYIPSNLRDKPPVSFQNFLQRVMYKVKGNPDQVIRAVEVSGLNPGLKLTEMDNSEVAVAYISTLLIGELRLALVGDLFSKVDDPLKPLVIKQTYKVLKEVGVDSLLFLSSAKYIGFCDKILVAARGKLMEEALGKEFYHPYTLTLINSVLRIGGRGERTPVNNQITFSDVGCPFHDSCELSRRDRKLRIKCILDEPKVVRVAENRVKCWYFLSENDNIFD